MDKINSILSSYRIPLLYLAVGLSLLLLIIVQLNWLLTSKSLIEEQFDQQINLALGSAVNNYNTKYEKDISLGSFNTCIGNQECYFFETDDYTVPVEEKKLLAQTITNQMTCFGIDDGYTLSMEEKEKYLQGETSLQSCDDETSLVVTFPSRSNYVYDKLFFMILSSVFISFLLGLVSFLILKSLTKQKKIAENNIDFFNNAAHELKTPLTNISLALGLFWKNNPEYKKGKYLNIIDRENSKLAHQIERVLYLSRMENGDYILDKEKIDLRELIKEAICYMELIIEENEAHVNVSLPEKPCYILGDRFHLSKVCSNLLENAFKYSNGNPVVNISLSQDCQNYKLTFADNGIGISKLDQEHIFEKFQRVGKGDVQDSKGFGIGLAYVKTALSLHKGAIKVNSELAKGSQFIISLPSYN